MAYTGGTFTLRHGDVVTIMLPVGAEITVAEANEGYTTSFKLNNESPVTAAATTFEFTDDSELLVTNRLDGLITAGVISTVGRAITLIFVPATAIGVVLYTRRRKEEQAA